MVDLPNGGFYGRIDGENNVHPNAKKGVILNTRILWTFSIAARHFEKPEYLKMANRAYDYLKLYFWDEQDGGVFWEVDEQGNPTETKKQIYAQGFAIYALSEYHLLTGNRESLQLAQEIFWLVEKYSLDPNHGGYLEAFSRGWELLEDLRLSDKDANEAKTMNTHLHVLEAYTNLYRVLPTDKLANRLVELVDLFQEKFIDPKTGHLRLFFDEEWNLKSHEISFGHDIEASWLLWECREVLGEKYPNPDQLKRTILKMAEATLTEGVDPKGGTWNEATLDGISDADKIWWVQAESMVGFLNAYQLTGDKKFLSATLDIWKFVEKNLKDRKNGEWYWAVDQECVPQIKHNKAGPWKAPYHHVRALLE
ncbi:UNVERIFIED_CONTAM: hypothetical protein GTU68_042621, partial [Idotea baltica]|nr:hypothetical protein [Idotea baltica]